ncbi:MAG: helix-turn-helix transcriptional regulator [Ruminococcaceae bacterium]|nr:helix-turn-helix transcriptional regulator [Oscillospiraceae bacterium]
MLSKKIYELRLSFGWTQVQLSQKLGVTKQTVSNWENDNIQPSIDMLIKLSKIFNVSTDYILGLTSENVINVDGLPTEFISHLVQIINDYKSK